MLEEMRNLFSIISLVFFITVAVVSTPSLAYAEEHGGALEFCTCKDNGNSPDYKCSTSVGDMGQTIDTDHKCENNNVCFTKSVTTIDCREKPTQQNTQVKCSCQNPGKQGSGNNGINCSDGQGQLGVTIYCDPGSYTCVQDANRSMIIGVNSKINERNYDPYDQRFKDKTVSGLACLSDAEFKKTLKVSCKCNTPATPGTTDTDFNGKNNFTCDGMTDKFALTCDDDDQGCYDDPKATIVLISGQGMRVHENANGGNDDFDNNLKGRTGTGVRCESKKDRQKQEDEKPWPTQPPPPPPPCARNTFTDGKCDNFNTAFGLMGTDSASLTKSIFGILLSFSGGLALLLIIRSGYTLMTSQGNPQRVQEGRDQLVAAIVGLVFLIFSFVLLQLIGYDLLRIPGFGP